ncbi:MAG: SRPBCC family protein [Chitinophagales bacterium]
MKQAVHCRVRLPVPVAEAWEVVTDPFRWPGWMVGVTGVRGEAPDQGQPAPRHHFLVEGRLGLWPFKARAEVTTAWQGTMIAFTGDCQGIGYLFTLTLGEQAGEATSVQWDVELRPASDRRSPFEALRLTFIRRAANSLARRSLANLGNAMQRTAGQRQEIIGGSE